MIIIGRLRIDDPLCYVARIEKAITDALNNGISIGYRLQGGKDDVREIEIFFSNNAGQSESVIVYSKDFITQNKKVTAKQVPWDLYYGLAKDYYEKNGHLRIAASYETDDGKKLGRWLYNCRLAYRGAGRVVITPEQVRQLEAIGMNWKLKGEI